MATTLRPCGPQSLYTDTTRLSEHVPMAGALSPLSPAVRVVTPTSHAQLLFRLSGRVSHLAPTNTLPPISTLYLQLLFTVRALCAIVRSLSIAMPYTAVPLILH